MRECTAEVPEECLPGREGLKDEKAMKGQLTSHKDLDSAIVVITLPTNAYNNCCRPQVALTTGSETTSAELSHGGQMKVPYGVSVLTI